MSVLWISDAAYTTLENEANRAYPLETGGVLVGYIADNGEPVISAVVGPGPNAVHRRTRFRPDHAWQCTQIDQLFAESSGVLAYIGDWHTHPNGSPRMSWLDQRTLRAIAKHAPAQAPHPLMLIGGGSADTWVWNGHQYRGESLLGIITETEKRYLQIFSPVVQTA